MPIADNLFLQFWSKLKTRWLTARQYPGSDSTVALFDAKTSRELERIPDSPNRVHWAPDGRTVAFLSPISTGTNVSLWDIQPDAGPIPKRETGGAVTCADSLIT